MKLKFQSKQLYETLVSNFSRAETKVLQAGDFIIDMALNKRAVVYNKKGGNDFFTPSLLYIKVKYVLLTASATRFDLFEEIVALVVYQDVPHIRCS